MLTRSPPFILGLRTGAHPWPAIPRTGQGGSHSLPLLVGKKQAVPPTEHFTNTPPLFAWEDEAEDLCLWLRERS